MAYGPDGSGRHLEAVAVRAVVAGVEAEGGLLGGDPRAPRRGAAGAVADGAGQRGIAGHQLFPLGVEDQIDRPPTGEAVVGLAGEGADLALDLVVADEMDRAPGAGEGGHPVVVVGRGPPVRHLVADRRETDVAEPVGEVELGTSPLERPVADIAGGGAQGLDGARSGNDRGSAGQRFKCPERAGGEDAGGHGAGPQKGATAHAHRNSLASDTSTGREPTFAR